MAEGLTVVIQAGGESRRMGRSKATVPFLGQPLISRSIKRLAPIADELIITTNEPEHLDFLYDMVASGDLRLQRDLLEVRGALNGLYTALKVACNPYVAVVACDMIFASADLIQAEVALLEASDVDAAIPATTHGFEPFHATYRRDTCLPIIEASIAAGETRATGWYGMANIAELSPDMVHDADSRGGCFMNVNTPEELAAMEERILSRHMTTVDGSGKDD